MNDVGAAQDGRQLIELLQQQCGLYRRLRWLAEQQQALVAREEAEPLMALLAKRQELVDGLVGLSGRLSPYRERWTAVYMGLAEVDRQRVAGLLEEANQALAMILTSDSRDGAALIARREEMAGRLTESGAAHRVGQAYARGAAVVAGGLLADSEA
jgi:hypothetical protein